MGFDDTLVTGPFTDDEAKKLTKKINRYMKKHNKTLDELLQRCGRNRCIATQLALKTLPHRDPRSVYNFIRRRLRTFKTGPWEPEDVLLLIESYITLSNQWHLISKNLNRSPEQVQNKWRELEPNIQMIIKKLQEANNKADKLKILADNISSKFSFTEQLDIKLYNLTRKHISNNKEDISWKTIQSYFPMYPQSRLRLHFYMSIVPKVLKIANPEFSPLVLGRYILYKINKLFKKPEFSFIGLKDIPFHNFSKVISVGFQQRCLIKLLKRTKKYSPLLTEDRLKALLLNTYKLYDVKANKRNDKKIMKKINTDGLPAEYPVRK